MKPYPKGTKLLIVNKRADFLFTEFSIGETVVAENSSSLDNKGQICTSESKKHQEFIFYEEVIPYSKLTKLLCTK